MSKTQVPIQQLKAPGATVGHVLTVADTDGNIEAQEGGGGNSIEYAAFSKGVSLKAETETTIFTVPVGKRFILTRLTLAIDYIAGAADMPTVCWGNDSDPVAFVALEAIDPTMNAVGRVQIWEALADVQTAGSQIRFGVVAGGTSTSHSGTVIVEGMMIDVP